MKMIAKSAFGSPAFHVVVKGLLALHQLSEENQADSPEAEYVRDALDTPLNALNTTERERAQWLSEDLYSVSELVDTISYEAMTFRAQQDLGEAFEARMSGDWDRALTLLRRSKNHISPILVCYFRGSIWLDAGYPEIAAVFFGHASRGEPSNANYQAHYLSAVDQSDPDAARKLAGEILDQDEKYPPVVVAQAADIRFKEMKNSTDPRSARFFRDQIPILERNMARIQDDDASALRVPAYTMSASLLGFCYEFLGNASAAVNSFSRGLQFDPDNEGLLIARGIHLYGKSPHAISDFERAVKLGSSAIWPYLFLAHQYLITKRYSDCVSICEKGKIVHGSRTAKSQLDAWQAISQAELGFPPELVRLAFEAAIRLDPSNDSARRNQLAYEESITAARTLSRSRWEEPSEASVRQFGIVEQRSPLAAA